MPSNDNERQTSTGLPPGRQRLADAIAELYKLLGELTLAQVSELLAAKNWRKDPSELSRYRSGRRKPPFTFVRQLHALALERAGSDAVATLPLDKLRQIHTAAESTLCPSCGPLRIENGQLRTEISRLASSQEDTDSEPANNAGPHASTDATPLPVPSGLGDRQRSAHDVSAARQVAMAATRLHKSGKTDHAVSWLQDVSTSLTPLESAASIVLLREGEGRLADTAVNIHGRTRAERDVLRIALELFEMGLDQDARAILRAAVR
ncbi:hypothetical protein SLA_2608 [Streptomyces laurentii]|uniref:Uncharacterized protein n=1 Tax=Streptomyces laurentii TaxID=39478 RepID=A0A160NZQ3_STRLU|nr:hypothetical protein SLA_2608 [Streptomyces laurentii]